MSEINYNIGLCGEYRLTVLDNKTVVGDTGWCKNTILSGGLEYLSTGSILGGLSYVDFGTSTLHSGEYNLSGVLIPSINTELINVSSNNIQYYSLNSSTQVYYATFSTKNASSRTETINEFCIKTSNQVGFSRTVLPTPIDVNIGQNINFEYRVTVDYSNEHQSNIEFTTYNGSSFYIPVTSKSYNLPNFDNDIASVGKLIDSYPLYLLQNNEELPSFGSNYPQERVYGVNDSQTQSIFYPSVVYSSLDAATKSYTVITEYNNLSAPLDSGIFNNINTALLTYKDSGFYASRFGFPLALYNTSLYANNTSVNSSNLMSLYYKYTWSETLSSTFTTPITFTLSAPQLIECNINQFVDLYPNSFITLYSNSFTTTTTNGNTTRIRVNLLGTNVFEAIDFNYFTPQVNKDVFEFGPSPYRVVVYDSNSEVLRDTGYVFPNINQEWNYNNTSTTSLNYYNTQLLALANQSITGATSGTTTLTNLSVYPGSNYIDVVINSPFIGTSWELILNTIRPVAIVEPIPTPPEPPVIPCNEITTSGGMGVTEEILALSPEGGIVIIDFNSQSVPDKLELIHNGTKVATSGMTTPNSGPFDNVYGSPTVPTEAQTYAVDQFIGAAKGAIPTRDEEFFIETSITDVTRVYQQLIWWTYTPENYTTSSTLTARVTGPSGTAWNFARRCTDQIPTPAPPSSEVIYATFNNQNNIITDDGTIKPSVIKPSIYGLNIISVDNGTFRSSVVSSNFYGLNNISVDNGTFRSSVISPNFYGLNNISVENGSFIPSVISSDFYGLNYVSIDDGSFTSPLLLPNFYGLNDISINDGSFISSVISPNFYGLNDISINDGVFRSSVISSNFYGLNDISINDGVFRSSVISPNFYGLNNISINDGIFRSSVISPNFYGLNNISINDGIFTP